MNDGLSTHKVEVFRIDTIEKHPQADRLGLVYPFGRGGYSCVVNADDFKVGDLACYIPPDSIAPDAPEFSFLGEHKRIKVRRYRGVLSQGLLMPAPPGAQIGDDVAKQMGITHYAPPDEEGGDNIKAPRRVAKRRYPKTFMGWLRFLFYAGVRAMGFYTHEPELTEEIPMQIPIFDVDSFYRYPSLFQAGEEVVATEKINGQNARFVFVPEPGMDGKFSSGRMYCGSHRQWKAAGPNNWWDALRQHPEVESFCRSNPLTVVFAEIFGPRAQGKYPYGVSPRKIGLAVFDLWENGRFLSYEEAHALDRESPEALRLPWAPEVYIGGFDPQRLLDLGNDLTSPTAACFGRQERAEGIVIKPLVERWDRTIGRVCLKIVSKLYLSKD